MCGKKFSCEVVTENYENPSIFVKDTAKNQWHLFYLDTVYNLLSVASSFVLALFNVQLLHIAYSFELSDSCIYLESWQPFTTETRWACKLASPKLMFSTIVDNCGRVPGYCHEFLGGRGSEG